MHILFACNSMQLGGAERYTMDAANILAEYDEIEVSVAFSGPVVHEPGFHPKVKICKLESTKGKLGYKRLFKDRKTYTTILNYATKNKVDFINTTMTGVGVWCWLVGRRLGIPVIHTPMRVPRYNHDLDRKITSSALGPAFTRGLNLHFLALSDFYAWDIKETMQVPEDRIHTVSLGVELGEHLPEPGKEALREELGLGDSPILGAVARFERVKGTHKLLAAAPALLEVCPNAKFLLVGDGSEREDLEKMVDELGVRDSVVFTGWRTDTADMIRLMDIYIQSTDAPNLGLSAIQAMSCGRAIAVFAKDELEARMAKDTAVEGVNGLIIPTNEPEKAGRMLGELLNQPQKLEAYGKASRELAEDRFSLQSHAQRLIELSQKMLKKNKKKGLLRDILKFS